MNHQADTKPSTEVLPTEKLPKKKKHFLSNKEFYQGLIEYQTAKRVAIEQGIEIPRVPESLGKCFLLLCQNLVYKHEFINYPFRDELVTEGVINCLLYMHNFNPERSNNPFAYFTQIVKNAYIRFIMMEYRKKNTINELMSSIDFESFSMEDDNQELHEYLNEVNRNRHEQYSSGYVAPQAKIRTPRKRIDDECALF